MKKLRKKMFLNKNVFVGIDVHVKTWHLSIYFERVIIKSFSQIPSPKQLSAFLNKEYPGANYFAVYEAGYCGFWIHEQLNKLGVETIVINPADVPTTNKDRDRKTDKRDSKTLAKMLSADLLNKIYVPNKKQLDVREILRHRRCLVKDQTRIKNRIKSKLRFYGIAFPEEFSKPGSHWSNRFLEWISTIELGYDSIALKSFLKHLKFLRKEILELTRQIRKISKEEEYSKIYNSIISAPGVGCITAMTLISEISDINRFGSMNKLASFVGLVPREHSSGEKQNIGHLSRRCNSYLRHILIEAAWCSIHRDQSLTDYYYESSLRMKKQKAIVKVARKLLSRIRLLWKSNEVYVNGLA